MKIGQISHYMPPHLGGIEIAAGRLAAAFERAGCSLRWLSSDAPPEGPPRPDQIRVPCWDGLNRRWGVPLPVGGRRAWRGVCALAEWADVLLIHDCLYPLSAMAVAAAWRAGTPSLLVQHTGPARYRSAALNAAQRAGFESLGRAVLAGADRAVAATPAARQLLTQLGFDAPLLPNGVDRDLFRPPLPGERGSERARLGLGAGRWALFVGRLIEKKGVERVIAASRAAPELRFLLVGEGPLSSQIPADQPNLRWIPRVEPEEMPRIYRAADLLLLPARGEGFPLTVQEAMCCGLPALVLESEPFAAPLVRGGACLGIQSDASLLAALRSPAGELAAVGARARGASRAWGLPECAGRYVEALLSLAGDGVV